MSHKRPCSACPHWKDGYCSIYARLQVGRADSCEYGRHAMRNSYSARWMANKRNLQGTVR